MVEFVYFVYFVYTSMPGGTLGDSGLFAVLLEVIRSFEHILTALVC